MKKTNGLIRTLGSLVLITSGTFGGIYSRFKQQDSEMAVYHFEQILFHDAKRKRDNIEPDQHLIPEQVKFCKEQIVMELDNVGFYGGCVNLSFYAFCAGAIGICSFSNNNFGEQYWNEIRERLPSSINSQEERDWTHDPSNPYRDFGKE